MPSEIDSFLQPVEKNDMDMLQWLRILISLTRKEEEEHFCVIKGNKLPQISQKRPKLVEKNHKLPSDTVGFEKTASLAMAELMTASAAATVHSGFKPFFKRLFIFG